jgi:putative DNA primase/helicase
MEWAWDRGAGSPIAPSRYRTKRGTTVEQAEGELSQDPERNETGLATKTFCANQIVPYHDPFLAANEFIKSERQNRFVTWQGTAWQWRMGKYQEIRPDELKATVGSYIDHWFTVNAEQEFARLDDPDDKARYKKKPVTAGVIQSACQAFSSISTIPERHLPKMPYWIDRNQADWDPTETIALRNCILNVRTKQTQDLTNRWFSKVRSNVEWTGITADCQDWKSFLNSCFPNDPESIELLQMYFGLCLTSNTSFQKILAMIGPPRSGKGTISRTLANLLGPESVASLGIGDLAREFGLEKLIGVPVAIMPDVRFGSRDNVSDAIERILSISGEDEIRIARKYQSDWSGKLPTRLIMASNEMPRLPDAAAAIPTRLLVLQFTESHVGREDQTLQARISAEMTGILAWAVEGYSKLLQAGKFPENDSTSNAIEEAKEIGSPAQAFLSDCIEVTNNENETLEIGKIYDVYKQWCGQTGRNPSCIQTISKQIKDLYPKLRVARIGNRTETRKRCLRGLIFTDYGWRLNVESGRISSDY